MAKRVRIKGKGAAIFLGDNKTSSQQNIKPASHLKDEKSNTIKATFYLPEELVDELEEVWLTLRKKYKQRKVTKSEIVQVALRKAFEQWKNTNWAEWG
ncbi:hypothetical protein H5U35_02635 [Candidatus Aerophobetes bacterium]|nr:hypothetical protein [Candidatus Aerophobetes bacterium]